MCDVATSKQRPPEPPNPNDAVRATLMVAVIGAVLTWPEIIPVVMVILTLLALNQNAKK